MYNKHLLTRTRPFRAEGHTHYYLNTTADTWEEVDQLQRAVRVNGHPYAYLMCGPPEYNAMQIVGPNITITKCRYSNVTPLLIVQGCTIYIRPRNDENIKPQFPLGRNKWPRRRRGQNQKTFQKHPC